MKEMAIKYEIFNESKSILDVVSKDEERELETSSMEENGFVNWWGERGLMRFKRIL